MKKLKSGFAIILILIMALSFTTMTVAASSSPVKFQSFTAKKDKKGSVKIETVFKLTSKKKLKKISLLCALRDKRGKKIAYNVSKSKTKSVWLNISGDMVKKQKYFAEWNGKLRNPDAKELKIYKLKIVYKKSGKRTINYVKKYEL